MSAEGGQAPVPAQRHPTLLLNTDDDHRDIASTVRREVRQAGHEYVGRVRTLIEEMEASLAEERLLAALSIGFAVAGLTLAAIGLYGLLNFSVARRTKEVAIRMALGAERRQIVRLVVNQAISLIVAGTIIGVPITLAAGRAVRALLHGVAPFQIEPLAASITILGVVGALAAWIPARRAVSIEPWKTLRRD